MRSYSVNFVEHVKDAIATDPKNPVLQLAKLCVTRGIALSDVATRLDVSRMSLYNWIYGRFEPHPKHAHNIKELVKELKSTK